jgi:hypothetical protein
MTTTGLEGTNSKYWTIGSQGHLTDVATSPIGDPINAVRFSTWAEEVELKVPKELGQYLGKAKAGKKSKTSVEKEHKELVSTYKILVGLAIKLTEGDKRKEASTIKDLLDKTNRNTNTDNEDYSVGLDTIRKILAEGRSYLSSR